MKKSLLFCLCLALVAGSLFGQATELEPCPPPFEGRPAELKYVTVTIDQLMELLMVGKVLHNQGELQLEFTAQSKDPNIFEGLPLDGELVDFIGVFSRVRRLESPTLPALDSPSCYFVSIAVQAGTLKKEDGKS